MAERILVVPTDIISYPFYKFSSMTLVCLTIWECYAVQTNFMALHKHFVAIKRHNFKTSSITHLVSFEAQEKTLSIILFPTCSNKCVVVYNDSEAWGKKFHLFQLQC